MVALIIFGLNHKMLSQKNQSNNVQEQIFSMSLHHSEQKDATIQAYATVHGAS